MRSMALALVLCLSLPRDRRWRRRRRHRTCSRPRPSRRATRSASQTIEKLKDFLPEQFWENREFFFYEGMQMEIGPTLRKYGDADAYREMSEKNKGKAKIVEDGALGRLPRRPAVRRTRRSTARVIRTPARRSSGTS